MCHPATVTSVGDIPGDDAYDEGHDCCEEGTIFSSGDHGDNRSEAVDAVEIGEVDDECGTPVNARGG